MVAIELKFIAGRFHATPWGRHVNEGVSEWPPSPWRLLRTLVALWHRDMQGQGSDLFQSLLNKLAELPSFHLPPVTQGNTQHYLPVGKEKRLAFDTFLLIDRNNPIYIIWPGASLTDDENQLLSRLLFGATYFGRGESWADIRLVTKHPKINCYPITDNQPQGTEVVRVLTPQPDQNLIDNLQYDTRVKRTEGILDPLGSRWINYARPNDVFAVSYKPPAFRDRVITVIRFSLYGKPLPKITETVSLGELARSAAMAIYGRNNDGTPSAVLSGKDADGKPLRNHQHAYYLTTDEDRNGNLDHLTIYVPQGISGKELDALSSLRKLNPGGGKPETGLFLLGMSKEADINALPFMESDTWTSVTPFVLGRFPKYYRTGKPKLRVDGLQIDGHVDQVNREWELRREFNTELPKLLSIEPVAACSLQGRTQSWASFRMWRKRGARTKIPGMAYGFRLRFRTPIKGPITLGYGSHFGLGMFFPETTSDYDY